MPITHNTSLPASSKSIHSLNNVYMSTSPGSNVPLGNSKHYLNQKHPRTGTDNAPFYGETLPKRRWPHNIQEEFAADLCRLFVACNGAWWAVEHPFCRYFFTKWISKAVLPGRKTLSGWILDNEAEKVVNRMRQQVNGKFATGQSDGWKNISKTSLIGSIINVESTVSYLHLLDHKNSIDKHSYSPALAFECLWYLCSCEECWELAWHCCWRDTILYRGSVNNNCCLVYGC